MWQENRAACRLRRGIWRLRRLPRRLMTMTIAARRAVPVGSLLVQLQVRTAHFEPVNEHKHSGLQSLKRFGTVLGRRKSGHPYGRSSSPDRKSSTNLSSAFSGFGKKKDRDMPSPAPDRRPVSPMRRLSTPKEEVSPRQMRHSGDDRRNGTLAAEPVAEPIRPATATNGTTHETIPELNELNEVFVAQQQQQSQPQPQSQVQSQPEVQPANAVTQSVS